MEKIVKQIAQDLKDLMGFVKDHMATKADIAEIRSEMATKENLENYATKDDLQNFATKDDLRNFATKDDLQTVKEEILDAIHPTEKAVDKDAVTIVDHGRRISRIEKHLSL